jgi:hypothetical protein
MTTAERKFDLALLRRHTHFTGRDPPPWYVAAFWRILESFPDEDRRRFLRFAWGREVLPLNDEGFRNSQLVISVQDLPGHSRLPSSSTCSFKIDLPIYATEEELRNKLLYAIRECVTLDGDTAVSYSVTEQVFTQARLSDNQTE